jgi:LPS export ABC transporter protein LptC
MNTAASWARSAALALLTGAISACSSGMELAADAGAQGRDLDPGYSLRGAEIVEMSADGRPRYTLRAKSARQDPDTLEVALDELTLELRDTRGSLWSVTAAQGRMSQDTAKVLLSGGVLVAGTGPVPLQIRSEQLAIDTEAQRVSTAGAVRITMAGGPELQARGLDANLKSRQVTLESKVHGSFRPD